MIHELKTHSEYFEAVVKGIKTFEIRENDRKFQVGDLLQLREYIPPGDPNCEIHVHLMGDGKCTCSQFKAYYTGAEHWVQVTYITNFNQKPGFVVMGIKEPYFK